MKIIVGLGNPGKQYEKTRHNAGFIILDELQKKWGFPEFSLSKKFNAEISEGIAKRFTLPLESSTHPPKIILVKPQSFMNHSGKAVRTIMDFYKLEPKDMIVIHDDLDIDLGSFKISTNTSAGGHNGIQSIIDHIGTQQFKRIRIGIEGAERKKTRTIPGDVFVLQNFSEEELNEISKVNNDIEIYL